MAVMPTKKAALRRAHVRRKSAGAAMFIVAVTLGLLAAMGVYGLAATASDVRAAGHVREAAQAQRAAELAIVEAASTIGPGTASTIVRAMQADSGFGARSNTSATGAYLCKSAKPPAATADLQAAARVAEACMVLTPKQMRLMAPDQNWNVSAFDSPTLPFSTTSFGEVPVQPYVRIELTNPIDWDVPAGYQIGGGSSARPPIFTQIRATVYLELRDNVKQLTAPAQVIATGRGRLVVGPYTP